MATQHSPIYPHGRTPQAREAPTGFPPVPARQPALGQEPRRPYGYFGSWDDPETALREYQAFLTTGAKAPAPRSKPSETPGKPAKPYEDFPLFAHASGRWAKKIRGRVHYFGSWDDASGALTRYLESKDDLHAGRTPRPKEGELTLRDLVNLFLTAKRHLVDSREITARTWADYYTSCGRLLRALGKDRLVTDVRADDLTRYRAALARKWGPVAVGNEIQRVRCLFKFGYDSELLDNPMRFGPGFKKPSKKVMRKERAKKGLRMFEAEALRKILDNAGQPLRTMILLAVNTGFGNADIGTVPLDALDLERGWINYPRPKTGIERRCKLWPETVEALKDWLSQRPKANDREHARLVFLTRWGGPWHQVVNRERLSEENISPAVDNPLSKETAKLLAKLELKRPGLNFYALRHTFETIAGESRDQVAVDHIMGHARDDMASNYRERISDDRLKAVAELVRTWLFTEPDKDNDEEPAIIPITAS